MRPAGGCAKGTAGLIVVLCCAQVSAADFWIDGNLTGLEELTQSGNQHFVTNAGFTDGKNYEMVFGSAIARGLGGPTALYNDERRAKVATEILVLLAQQPSLDGEEVESPQEFLQKIGLRAEAIAHANDLLITYTRKYVKATSLPARAHNNLAKQLRDIDPRTIKTLAGRKVHTSNLQHFGAYLEILDGALMISDIAVGASLRAAVQADIALTRLEILQATLERNPDPAIRNAIRNAQQVLDLGEDFWGALVVEMDARSADIQKFGAQVVLHRSVHAAVAKAATVAAKAKLTVASIGVVLVFETIASDWDQHDTAQIAVMAATLEEVLRRAGESTKDTGEACELGKAVAMARYIYFDRMARVSSVWQGAWVDLLSRGRPYADASAYFQNERQIYMDAALQQRGMTCFEVALPSTSLPVGCESVDLAMLIDSSGSMQDNDPRGLRREAAGLLIDRAPPGAVFSVVDFDSSATAMVSRSSSKEEARSAVARVNADGGTDIESALVTGYQLLAQGTGARAAILFTDGRSDRRGGADGFVKDGISVHVVGLGSGVDTDYLQRLAASTGGLYMHAAGAGDLAQVFDRAISELACEGTVFSRDGVIRPGERIEHPFVVDATIARLTARVTWPGSRIDLELIDPGGRPAGIEVGSGSTYRIVEVNNPQPGQWTARVIGTQVAASGEPFTFRAGGPSNLRLAASQADPKDPTTLKIATIDNGVGASVSRTWSRIEKPDRATIDGPELSNLGSGAWSLSVPIDKAGIYTVTAGLAGTLRDGGNWVRETTRTVVVGQGMVPWRGVITRVEGGYVTINRGSNHGVREGMSVTFRPGGSTAGSGIVISVFSSSATVEVQELWGSAMAEQGMTIELDRTQWMADTRW